MIQFPKSSRGNQYAVVFVDYLTKWPEVFPVKNLSLLNYLWNILLAVMASQISCPREALIFVKSIG